MLAKKPITGFRKLIYSSLNLPCDHVYNGRHRDPEACSRNRAIDVFHGLEKSPRSWLRGFHLVSDRNVPESDTVVALDVLLDPRVGLDGRSRQLHITDGISMLTNLSEFCPYHPAK